jgi:hypothetical protein
MCALVVVFPPYFQTKLAVCSLFHKKKEKHCLQAWLQQMK